MRTPNREPAVIRALVWALFLLTAIWFGGGTVAFVLGGAR